LILSDNELDCLPPSISSLTSLERLDLSRNGMKEKESIYSANYLLFFSLI
jgi:Leucine-rich repeat (LRR) protein